MNPRTEEKIWIAVLWASAGLVVLPLLLIVGNVLINGLSTISLEFLLQSPRAMGKEGGIFSSIVATVQLLAFALAIAVPLGVGAAIYLVEYKKDGAFLRLIRFNTESLAGIPSIIFGVFGFTFFVLYLKLGWSILSGGLTLALMVLPIIIRTSEEAIAAVPNSHREGSMGVGATKWQTITRVVLPSARAGILTGVTLSLGRAIGESAAVMLTAGSALGIPRNLSDPGRSLAVHLYVLAVEGLSMKRAYGTATVLILAVLAVNLLVALLRGKQRVRA